MTSKAALEKKAKSENAKNKKNAQKHATGVTIDQKSGPNIVKISEEEKAYSLQWNDTVSVSHRSRVRRKAKKNSKGKYPKGTKADKNGYLLKKGKDGKWHYAYKTKKVRRKGKNGKYVWKTVYVYKTHTTKHPRAHVDHYEIQWQYWTDKNGWKSETEVESESTLIGGFASHKITLGNNEKITKIRARIKPVAKTHTVKYSYYTVKSKGRGKKKTYYLSRGTKSVTVSYFDGSWSGWSEHKIEATGTSGGNPDPSVPSLSVSIGDAGYPEITISGVDATATDSVQLYFVDGPAKTATVSDADYRKLGHELKAGTSLYVDTSASRGASRAYSARGIKSVGEETYRSKLSDLTQFYDMIPTVPELVSAKALTDTTVQVVAKATGSVGKTWNVYYAEHSFEEGERPSSASFTDNVILENGAERVMVVTGLTAGKKYWFRVTRTSDGGESGYSGIYSASVGSTPEAPTLNATPAYVQAGDAIELSWIHNCEDKSEQTDAEIVVYNGPSDETGTTYHPVSDQSTGNSTADSFLSLATSSFADGSVVRWKVRTKGASDEFGPFSEVASFTVYAAPSLALGIYAGDDSSTGTAVADGGSLPGYPFSIKAQLASSLQKPVAYEFSISNAEETAVESFDGTASVLPAGTSFWRDYAMTKSSPYEIPVTPAEVDLNPGVTYTLSATVYTSAGMSASQSISFKAGWADVKPEISADAIYSPGDLTARIMPKITASIADYDESGNAIGSPVVTADPDAYVTVYRISSDGDEAYALSPFVRNRAGLEFVDPHPNFGRSWYRIVAYNDSTGAMSYITVPVDVPETDIVLQWDQSILVDYDGDGKLEMSQMVRLPYDVKTSTKHSKDVAMREFIGRNHPVSYYGTQVGQSASWSANIVKDVDDVTLQQLKALAVYMGDVYVRERSGDGYWATVDVSIDETYGSNKIAVSLDIKQTDRTDAVELEETPTGAQTPTDEEQDESVAQQNEQMAQESTSDTDEGEVVADSGIAADEDMSSESTADLGTEVDESTILPDEYEDFEDTADYSGIDDSGSEAGDEIEVAGGE